MIISIKLKLYCILCQPIQIFESTASQLLYYLPHPDGNTSFQVFFVCFRKGKQFTSCKQNEVLFDHLYWDRFVKNTSAFDQRLPEIRSRNNSWPLWLPISQLFTSLLVFDLSFIIMSRIFCWSPSYLLRFCWSSTLWLLPGKKWLVFACLLLFLGRLDWHLDITRLIPFAICPTGHSGISL